MKRTILLFLTMIMFLPVFSQTQNLSLTKSNIEKLFKTDFNYVPGIKQNPEWTTCFDSYGSYINADTIQLYSDKYHYMTEKCCCDISWSFKNSTTVTIFETNVCQEPPPTTVSINNENLTIKFKDRDSSLIMTLYKNGKLKDRFVLISLDNFKMRNGKMGYKLTMIREKQ